MITDLTEEPWPIARLLRLVHTSSGLRALVQADGSRRMVTLHPDCEAGDLHPGDFVQLSSERNILMDTLGTSLPMGGELASFDRFTQDGRIVLRSREEELIVDPGARLDTDSLEPGDPVRWDRATEIALERFEPHAGQSFLLEDVEPTTATVVRSLGVTFEQLFESLANPILDPVAAKQLELDEPPLALLSGPPGCGKTLTAKTLAAELRRLTGRRVRFAVVRPGEFQSAFVGETERRIRDCFDALKRTAGSDLVVLFLDEIDTIGRSRGGMTSHHSDRALGVLLAELDGFEKRGNVAIIAATNRRDMLDPALMSRFAGMDIRVARPRLDAARTILEAHLVASLPYSPNGLAAADTRAAAVESAISKLYAPNGGAEVCRLRMRGGTTRDVHARELVSGRTLAHIARNAKRNALRRSASGDDLGITTSDVDAAVADILRDLSTLLTPVNARSYLDDLPQDADIVSVEPLRPLVVRSTRIAHVA